MNAFFESPAGLALLQRSGDEIRSFINSTLRNLPIGVAVLDDTLSLCYCNAPAEQILGPAQTVLGRSIESFLLNHELVDSLFPSLWNGSELSRLITMRHIDGNERHVKIHVSHFSGQTILFLEDYSEINRLEEDLCYFKTAIESAADAIFLFDPRGLILFLNPAFEKQVGLPPERILGEHVRRFWSDKSSNISFKDLWNQISDGNSWLGELTSVRDGQGEFNVDVRITPILGCGNGIRGFLCIQQDITSHKEHEWELEQTSEQLKTHITERSEALEKLHEISHLFHSTDTLESRLRLILIAATAGEAFGFNRAFLFLLDPDREELVGRMAIGPSSAEEASNIWGRIEELRLKGSIKEILQCYLANSKHDESAVTQIVQELSTSLSNEASILTQAVKQERSFLVLEGRTNTLFDPSILPILGSDNFAVIPLLIPDGAVGAVIVDNIITRQLISEEDIKMLEILAGQAALGIAHANTMEQLARKVEEAEAANLKLLRSQKKLIESEKFAALGQMAATVAHEIRTPLVSIGGFAKILLKNHNPNHADNRYLTIIRDEALRLEDVLNRLLFYARPPSLQLDLHNLNEFVSNVLSFLTAEIDYHEVKLKTDFDPQLPPIRFDRNLMRQVIINIVQNGIQSMEKGGTLYIETRDTGDETLLTFKDTGVGISTGKLNRVFEAFYSTKSAGIGLGLHVTKRIITEHGGTIEIESKVGVGTTVYVRLPKEKGLSP